ncbi:hypothetical protein [Pedobacter sp. UBA4863]|uniref:hypothetical protein n=1 Tax=Pedobacter sp. UBA4863 TaxID=1947060 RepID=UPI0025FE6D71|nr:hypothetical protein [Pedobacter sp. UBA4863]
MNGYYQDVKIHTSAPAIVVYKKDSIRTINDEVVLSFQRNNSLKEFQIFSDSLNRKVAIKPFKSLTYWLNIPYTYGIGLFIDKGNDKRFGHPNHVYVTVSDTSKSKYTTYNNFENNFKKGAVKLHISLPWINSFYLRPANEKYKSNTGYWGINLGVDYYHTNYQFLELAVSGITDFFIPFPAAVDFAGEHEAMNALTISLSNNHHLGRFSFGYGLLATKNTWDLKYYDRWEVPSPSREPVSKSHYTFGLVFPSHVQLAKYFGIGLIYRPSLYRPLIEKLRYEHTISLDFAWKIKI